MIELLSALVVIEFLSALIVIVLQKTAAEFCISFLSPQILEQKQSSTFQIPRSEQCLKVSISEVKINWYHGMFFKCTILPHQGF